MKTPDLFKRTLINALLMIPCLLVTLSSCREQTSSIGGSVSNYYNDEPVEGVIIGLYKYIRDTDLISLQFAQWQDFMLTAEATTDSEGNFRFEVESDLDISTLFYILKPMQDTLSENCKYTSFNSEYSCRQAGWGQNASVRIIYSIGLFANVPEINMGDTIMISDGNSSYTIPSSGSGAHDYLNVEPGKQHTVNFYLLENGIEQYLENRNIYLKVFPAYGSGRIINEIPIQQVNVLLDNY
jgi:hypothetical protein